MRIHPLGRDIGFQEIAAVQQGIRCLGVFVDGAVNDPFIERERDERAELVAFDPALQEGQATLRAGALLVFHESVTFGELLLQLLQLVCSPPFLTHVSSGWKLTHRSG